MWNKETEDIREKNGRNRGLRVPQEITVRAGRSGVLW
jgi:hypothetical protein